MTSGQSGQRDVHVGLCLLCANSCVVGQCLGQCLTCLFQLATCDVCLGNSRECTSFVVQFVEFDEDLTGFSQLFQRFGKPAGLPKCFAELALHQRRASSMIEAFVDI